MPGMEGTEFFTHVAQLFPHTRRILISGYSDFFSVTEAFNEGIIHKFVIKPWDNEVLTNLVSDQLKIAESGDASELGVSAANAVCSCCRECPGGRR